MAGYLLLLGWLLTWLATHYLGIQWEFILGQLAKNPEAVSSKSFPYFEPLPTTIDEPLPTTIEEPHPTTIAEDSTTCAN